MWLWDGGGGWVYRWVWVRTFCGRETRGVEIVFYEVDSYLKLFDCLISYSAVLQRPLNALQLPYQHPKPTTMSPFESLSIAEIAIYPPILLALIFVCLRHGISKQSGFIYLATFCIIRIVGAGFGIAAAIHPANVTDQIWSGILGSIGIFSILGATGGLLKRM